MSHVMGKREGMGRQLAGEQGTSSEEDPDLEAIVQLCLEMEESYQLPGVRPHLQPVSHGSLEGDPGSHQGHLPNASQYFLQDLPQSHQGLGAQSDYGWLEPSAYVGETPESPAEGSPTSAWGSTAQWSLGGGGSLTSASDGYSSPMLPVDYRAPLPVQRPHMPIPAHTNRWDFPSGEPGSGTVLPGTQLWAHPGATTQVVQSNTQRDMRSEFSETLSVRKRRFEGHEERTSQALRKKRKASSEQRPGTPQYHETSEHAYLASPQELKSFEGAGELMTQNSGQGKNDSPVGLRSNESASSRISESPAPSTSRETNSVSRGMHQIPCPSEDSLEQAVEGGQDEVEATSDSDDSGDATPVELLNDHPFYRAPILERGADVRAFSLSGARTGWSPRNAIDFPMRVMRMLLMQDVVPKKDAEALVSQMELIAGHLINFHETSVIELVPVECVRVLGIRYLLLDTLFVASKLLEEAGQSNSWWSKLVENIPCDVNFQYRQSYGRKFEANMCLASKLSSAIRLLKSRIRPGSRTTVNLKRQLLCKRTSHQYFKHRNWSPWREDDENFRGSVG
ncbi:hypothetical protein, conserved [Eimeria brunetti]|uniref:Uncharacterized protein n=1 Tax=Eimeria brunetti TaxID=51314 RepID=U6LD42_9EIME|nr:hypothetical protein, conserved [Eimeria brunetti]